MSSRCCLPHLYRGSRVYMEHHMPCIGELYGPIYLCYRIQFHHALHHGNLWNDQIRQCQIYLIALRAFNLIIPTVFDQLILLKEEFLIAQLFFYVYLVLTMFYGFEYREKTVIFCKCWQKQHMEKFSAVLMKTVYEKW